MRDIQRFEEFDRSARVVRVFTRTLIKSYGPEAAALLSITDPSRGGAGMISDYDRHLLNRKPRPGVG
jgi:hypothetical protein